MSELQKRTLTEWLDDLCVRFIINLPQEELESVERICFQVEEAQWFYEDFIRPLDPTLPSMNLKKFCMVIFQHCPLLSEFSQYHHFAAFSEFLAYKQRVPVRGAIMLNDAMDQVVLVKGWKKGARWSFPRGKINKDESDLDCAIREVYEETGYDLAESGLANDSSRVHDIEVSMREQHMKLFVFRGVPMDTQFEPRTRKEISKIDWYRLSDLPTLKQARMHQTGEGGDAHQQSGKFYMVAPFLGPLKHWIRQQRKRDKLGLSAATVAAMPTDDEQVVEQAISDVEAAVFRQQPVEASSGHFNNLLAGLRASSQPVQLQPPSLHNERQQVDDSAAALKKMLNVGDATGHVGHQSTPPPRQAAPEMGGNSLLDLLRSNPPRTDAPQTVQYPPPGVLQLPATHFDQDTSVHPPSQVAPYYNHVIPHQNSPQTFVAPPPANRFTSPDAGQVSVGRLDPAPPSQMSNFGSRTRPEQASQLLSLFRSNAREDSSGAEARPVQQAGQSPSSSQAGGPVPHQVVVPQASKLPPPKLTAHTMSLLNAFTSPQPKAALPNSHLQTQISELSASDTSPPTKNLSPGSIATDSIHHNAPGGHSRQQVNLLQLFNTGSGNSAKTVGTAEPIELASQPSPHAPTRAVGTGSIDANLHATNLPRVANPDLTSATVTGPLRSPHFETLQRQQKGPAEIGHATANSPLSARHNIQTTLNIGAHPQLRVGGPERFPQARSPASVAPEVAWREGPQTSAPFQMSQRIPLLNNSYSVTSSPSPDQISRSNAVPATQKDALLSLFTSPSGSSGLNTKQTSVAGIFSPVSPLPVSGRSKTSSTRGSPAGTDGKSRVSSIASLPANDNMRPVTHGAGGPPLASTRTTGRGDGLTDGQQQHYAAQASKHASPGTPTTPVDKSVLLEFLQSVVKGT